MVKPVKGAIHCNAAEAAADATTNTQRSGAPNSLAAPMTRSTAVARWPTAT